MQYPGISYNYKVLHPSVHTEHLPAGIIIRFILTLRGFPVPCERLSSFKVKCTNHEWIKQIVSRYTHDQKQPMELFKEKAVQCDILPRNIKVFQMFHTTKIQEILFCSSNNLITCLKIKTVLEKMWNFPWISELFQHNRIYISCAI